MSDTITHILIGVSKTDRFILAAAPNEEAAKFAMHNVKSFKDVEFFELCEVKRVFKPWMEPYEVTVVDHQRITDK